MLFNFVVGLLSMGCLKHLFMLYDRIANLPGKPIYIDLIHILIVLSANPELVVCLLSSAVESVEVLKRCLLEIAGYLKYLKENRPQSFKTYFTFLL